MKKTILVLAILTWTTSLFAQATPTNQEFSWSAELVSLDEAGRNVTVKARVVGEQALTELARAKAGDKLVVIWSGMFNYSDGISRVNRVTAAAKLEDKFTIPVEFVAFDEARRHATIKIPIPPQNVADLKALKAGEWVTATSPHGASAQATPVMSIRPYVITASTAQRG